ncbi:hypothetical protein ES703_16158 [subsurface metagenome]
MANAFNISVAPDIAAAVVKIDANKTVIDENKVILLDVQGTKITSILTAIGLNKTELDGIRGADLTSILTNIAVNTTALTTNAGILNSIKAKTDIIGASVALETLGNIADIKAKTDDLPQNIRGKLYSAHLGTDNAAFQDVVNITGHGKIIRIVVWNTSVDDTSEFKTTLDATPSNAFSHTGDTDVQLLYCDSVVGAAVYYDSFSETPRERMGLLNIEFDTTFVAQLRRSAGSTDDVNCQIHYILDR